jgi:hypothetical protein
LGFRDGQINLREAGQGGLSPRHPGIIWLFPKKKLCAEARRSSLNALGRWKTETGWLNCLKVFCDRFHYCFDVRVGSAAEDNWLGGRILHLFISKVESQSHSITFDGFVKSPSAALRFILRHCGVLLCTPRSSKFARLAYEAFYCAVQFGTFLRSHPVFREREK